MTAREVYDGADTTGTKLWTHAYTASIDDRIATYTRTDEVDGSNNVTVDYDYNASGIRVSATSPDVTDRHFLIDPNNHTGYAQVIAERYADTAYGDMPSVDPDDPASAHPMSDLLYAREQKDATLGQQRPGTRSRFRECPTRHAGNLSLPFVRTGTRRYAGV